MRKKIIITGGAGFVGSQLGYDLHSDGYDVHLLDDMSFGYEDNLVVRGEPFGEFHRIDIRSPNLKEYFEKTDTVFHFAGISALPVNQENPYYAIDVNVAGTANVLESARLAGVRRVVFASTSAIYENNENFPCEEDDAVAPDLIYATSKLQAELICKAYAKAYGMEIAIVRYFNVYGPHQDFKRKSPPLTSYVVRELVAGRVPVLHSSGNQRRDYVHVKDVNRLNRICMYHTNAPGGIFNAASGCQISVNEIYKILSDQIGVNTEPLYRDAARFWDAYPHLFDGIYGLRRDRIIKEVEKNTLGTHARAKKLLGWSPEIDIELGLREMVDYVKVNYQKALLEVNFPNI